jgi:Peptidase U49
MAIDLAQSPIGPMIQQIERAPHVVVPERSAGLQAMTDQHGIRVVLKPEKDDFHVYVTPDREILLGIAVLERLWVYAHAYVNLLVVVQKHPGGMDLDLTTDPQSRPAMELLTWADDCEALYHQTPWPKGLPRPDPNAPDGSIDRRVHDIFLSMVAWLMLHETCHAVLRHPFSATTEEYRRQEFQADEWASEWMLHDRRNRALEYDRVFLDRALGATLTLSVFTTWEVRLRQGATETHPDPARRLLRFLDRFVPETSGRKAVLRELPWMMAGTVMQLHLTKHQRELLKPYDSFRGFYLDVIDALDTPTSSAGP